MMIESIALSWSQAMGGTPATATTVDRPGSLDSSMLAQANAATVSGT
jgi:hypothetical protein